MAIKNQIQFRRGSSPEWVSIYGGNGPTLNAGEPGFDSTNNILKIGDGSTNWLNLKPIHNINGVGATNNQYLIYNSTTGLWTPTSSGVFTSLVVNNVEVSVSGHTHTASNISDFTSSVNSLLPIANKEVFNVSSDQSVFTPSNPYTIGAIDVYYNGVKLIAGTDFTASNGTTITFSSPAIAGSVVEVVTTASSISYKDFLQSKIIHPFLLGGI